MSIFDDILKARGLNGDVREAFLHPNYEAKHDPFLLPDMPAAVDRLVAARGRQEKITIYGDYDIDGLTATTVLLDGFDSFGFSQVDAFIPNRFVEGYGLTVDAVERIAATGSTLIVTVDCGSLSEKEIVRAGELGVEVIVTDHHNVAPVQPPAVAVINPKRLLADYPEAYEKYVLKPSLPSSEIPTESPRRSLATGPIDESAPDSRSSMGRDAKSGATPLVVTRPSATMEPPTNLYPFLDLAGVGVAFKLIQALQTRLPGLPEGQEKWLLDLVALGTVCDVVTLVNENRANVFWGLKVLAKPKRPGLKALMAVAGVEPAKVNARSLGFGLGPRMNAAGRLETAQHALDMLRAVDPMVALEKAQQLDTLNMARRADQDKIFKAAIIQAERYVSDDVLVVSSPRWNHGIIGIVAAKLLEKYHKPTYVLEEMGEESKGSARSYGDFSAADAIRASDDIITKGGGHKLAAGVTMPTTNIAAFRKRVNEFYRSQKLLNQAALLLPKADVTTDFNQVTEALIEHLDTLEPFGSGNPQPVLKSENVLVTNLRRMGADAQHVKLELQDSTGKKLQMLAFNAPESFLVEPGERVTVWYQPDINEWQGRRTVEGRLLHLELA
ncbi:MAG: DHH family phosphoesterase [Candidatus Saccharimonadales bacterium]